VVDLVFVDPRHRRSRLYLYPPGLVLKEFDRNAGSRLGLSADAFTCRGAYSLFLRNFITLLMRQNRCAPR
jgi:hypothetical protein